MKLGSQATCTARTTGSLSAVCSQMYRHVLLPWQRQQCRSFHRVQQGTSAVRGLIHSRLYGITRNAQTCWVLAAWQRGAPPTWDAEATAQQGLPESGSCSSLVPSAVSPWTPQHEAPRHSNCVPQVRLAQPGRLDAAALFSLTG